ncbi:MAG: TraB/GumN family protein [Bacteroidales bacterium]
MKKHLLLLGLAFLVLTQCDSQPLEKGLLWKITGEGLSAPSYLYGTYHMLCPDDLVISDETKHALSDCEQVVLEMDLDDSGLMLTLQQGMFFQDGTTAGDYLSEADHALVEAFFAEKMNMPFQPMTSIKPMFLASMTLLYYLECQPSSPEQVFAGMASEQEKEVLGLETVAEQIGFMDAISLEDAAKILVGGIEDLDEGRAMTGEIVRTYLSGDLEGIQQVIDRHLGNEYAGINEDLILSRNRDWIPKIRTLIQEKASFIAVGAGHLPGEQGVIRMLREAGYTVEAVR